MRKPKPSRRPPVAPLAAALAEAIGAVPEGRTGREPSALREHVSAVFEVLGKRKADGATWDDLAKPFAAMGIVNGHGDPPTGVDLRNAWHAENYVRGGPRKRRTPKPKVVQIGPPTPTRPEVPDPPPITPTRPEVMPPAPSPPDPAAGADKLRAVLARKRQDIGEPNTLTFDAEDRRRKPENDEHG